MAVSVRSAFQHINSVLGNDAELNSLGIGPNDIFAMKGPESHPTPYVLTERPAGRHHYAMGGGETHQEHWIVIKVITNGTRGATQGREIIGRINEVLTGSTMSVTGGYSLRVEAVSEMEYVDAEAGNILFFHVGTMFKFLLGTD